MLLDKYYNEAWIRSLSGLDKHYVIQHAYKLLVPGSEFSKTQKGTVGEDALLVALDSARKVELWKLGLRWFDWSAISGARLGCPLVLGAG